MPDTDTAAELARLRAMLRTREGQPGYARNCEAIRKRIAELEAASDV